MDALGRRFSMASPNIFSENDTTRFSRDLGLLDHYRFGPLKHEKIKPFLEGLLHFLAYDYKWPEQ